MIAICPEGFLPANPHLLKELDCLSSISKKSLEDCDELSSDYFSDNTPTSIKLPENNFAFLHNQMNMGDLADKGYFISGDSATTKKRKLEERVEMGDKVRDLSIYNQKREGHAGLRSAGLGWVQEVLLIGHNRDNTRIVKVRTCGGQALYIDYQFLRDNNPALLCNFFKGSIRILDIQV